MRIVAFAACAAAFWISVATLRLMIHAARPCAQPPVAIGKVPVPALPAAPVEPLPPEVGGTCPPRVPVADQMRRARDINGLNDYTRAMNDLRPELCVCWQQHKSTELRGRANLHLNIARSGRVSSVSVTGLNARTGLGACVAAAAKTGIFPRTRTPTAAAFTFVMK